MLIRVNAASELNAVEAQAAHAERLGYDILSTSEVAHDPFLPLALASRSTATIKLSTAIAVAFARTPMAMANICWDLHAMSGGRFILGLGSQIKAHIERRFSMPWSHPAPRMAEYVQAMRAIWTTYQTGEPLNFRGEFYQHTLMTPYFTPPPIPDVELPKIFVAGVGGKMVETAAEVSDGLLMHTFGTRRYEEQAILRTVETTLAAAGKARADFVITGLPFVITGVTEEAMAAQAERVRGEVAFYASTPAYRPVMDIHGWGEAADELTAMTKRKEWSKIAEVITDEMLAQFAVIAEPAGLAAALRKRAEGVMDHLGLVLPDGFSDEQIAGLLAELKG